MIRGALKKIYAILFIFTLCSGVLSAQILFEYQHSEGDKWHLTSRVDEDVIINGRLHHKTEILNKISVEILQAEDGSAKLSNVYQIAERPEGSSVYIWSAEYTAQYWRSRWGRVSGLQNHPPVPSVRNVPVFPARELSAGDTWSEAGTELFDLQPTYGIDEIVVIDFVADYEYIGTEILDKRRTEKVLIAYGFEWSPDELMLERLRDYAFFPVSISGDFTQNVYWDSAYGRNFAEDGEFSYTYFMSDGQSFTFRGYSEGQAVYIEPLDRDALIEEIEQLDDVDIQDSDAGVVISLENIHFIPDSPRMLYGETHKLDSIADILKKYPERDILVAGHTAQVYSYSDGVVLSQQRAETVARYFIDRGIRTPSQILTRGMGHSQPVAANDTEEGRKKNRRVEITILEN